MLQRRLWLKRPMRERQYLLQTSHLCVVSGRMELLPSFLRARLSAAAAVSFCSPVLICCFRALLHFVRSAARPSQDIVSMSTAFMSLTQTCWYRRWFSSPMTARRRGCILECDHVRRTWPNHRSLRCLSRVYILGRPARDKTSLKTRLRGWEAFSIAPKYYSKSGEWLNEWTMHQFTK